MAQSSLSKLQASVSKLESRNFRLRESLDNQISKNKNLQKSINNLNKNFEAKIKKAVELAVKQAVDDIIEENKKLKRENAKLKRLLNLDSNNSGIPTSKSRIGQVKRIPNSREKSFKPKGGQIGHKKFKLEKFNDDEITDTITFGITNPSCSCGGLLILTGKRCKDEFDIDVRLIKRRNEFCEYTCDSCHKQIKIPIPDRLKEDNQYGSGAQALALSLVNEGFVSFHRTKELISGFTNNEMNMSEGFIAKLQKRCFDNLSSFDNNLHQKLLFEPIIHWDDTVINVNAKPACLRFYGTDNLRYYKAHLKKSKSTLDDDAILPFLGSNTVVVHDHNKVNYNDDYSFTNAECCVHLVRELKALDEVFPRKWLKDMINLFLNTNEIRKMFISKNILYFDNKITDKVCLDYDDILNKALKKNTNDSLISKVSFLNDEFNLIKRLSDYKQNYLLWILRFDVPFSNNLSERSLRSSKTKMKVSGTFSNIQNAEYFARIKSYIETCKANNINPYLALKRLIENNPFSIDELISN